MAAATNKQAQSNRSRDGKAHEDLMHTMLRDWLVRAKMDTYFDILKPPKIEVLAPRPGTRTVELRPDLVIVQARTQQAVVFGGAKKSFRERVYQDVFIADALKQLFCGTFWIEQTASEHTAPEGDEVFNFVNRMLGKWGGYFDALYSTVDLRTQTTARNSLLAHLEKHIVNAPDFYPQPSINWAQSQNIALRIR